MSIAPTLPSVAAPHAVSAFLPANAVMLDNVAALTTRELTPLVAIIDKGGYPAAYLRELGPVGAYGAHVSEPSVLGATIEAMSRISATCLSTGFMHWCQSTLIWYIMNSEIAALKARYLAPCIAGEKLGGTGLSNPMKALFEIETFRLKGTKVEGGYRVKGVLPWVSNLGPDHLFGTMFETADGEKVMCLIDCADPAVTLKPCEPFLALDGTGTFSVQVRDLLITGDMILANPAMPYIKKIRAGFVLLQAGMAIGLVRDCIAMMDEVRSSLGHINSYLEVQPEDLSAQLAALEADVFELAKTPYDTSDAYWKRVLVARLAGGEASVAAAHNAMLHCGARGYVAAHRCQRRLREAYFIAIVTPATKQLKKMILELPQVA